MEAAAQHTHLICTLYADPCAEHALAMMLSLARRLPDSLDAQRGSRAWQSEERRAQSFLLRGQMVLLLGYGAIGRRLAQLLWSAPGCYVTPHSAGGRREEHRALVEHFLANLRRFEHGEPLLDRVL